jgi:hypothetical protein
MGCAGTHLSPYRRIQMGCAGMTHLRPCRQIQMRCAGMTHLRPCRHIQMVCGGIYILVLVVTFRWSVLVWHISVLVQYVLKALSRAVHLMLSEKA